MVAYNFTHDDTSAMIDYSGDWSRLHTDDRKTNQYFMNTFASTTFVNASATLRFNGSGIWAYGAKRYNHARYIATLDGKANIYSGFLSEPEAIQAVLFSQTGLDTSVEHTLTLANSDENWFFDVDYYIVQNEETEETNELNVQTVTVDTPSSEFFKYDGQWKLDYAGSEYHNKTGAMSYSAGESISFSFTGTSVAVFGAVNSNHGVYTVLCDGIAANYTGWYNGGLTGGAVLYHRANLENVTHTVTLINQAAAPTNYFGVDYVQYNYTTKGTPIPCTTCSSSSTRTTSSTSSTSLMSSTSSTSSTSRTALIMATTSQAIDSSSEFIWSATTDSASILEAPPSSSPNEVPTASAGGANASSTSRKHHGLSDGALAGIIIGGVALAALIVFLAWRCVRKRDKASSLYHWDDHSALSLISTEGDKSSPMAFVSPVGRSQDSSGLDRRMNSAWPSNAASPVMQQTGFLPGEMLPHAAPSAGYYDYYPHALSLNPNTEEGSPISREGNVPNFGSEGHGRAQRLHYTAPSSAALPSSLGVHQPIYATSSTGAHSSSLGALLRNYAAPSSAALPSSPEDPAEIRIASQAFANRPSLLTVGNTSRASQLQRNVSSVSTPSSTATIGSRGRKQVGVALPPTSAPPASALSEERLRQMRMIVDGRPQDWGPMSIPDDTRSEARTTLPPAYAQATEPLPGQLMPVYPRRTGQI